MPRLQIIFEGGGYVASYAASVSVKEGEPSLIVENGIRKVRFLSKEAVEWAFAIVSAPNTDEAIALCEAVLRSAE